MRHVDNLPLADPNSNAPGRIDVLLGSDVLEDVMFDIGIKGNGFSIRESLFGWVISGPIKNAGCTIVANNVALDAGTHQLITRFWELDSVQEQKHQTNEEQGCEKYSTETTRHSDDGRFIVQMHFKTSNVQL